MSGTVATGINGTTPIQHNASGTTTCTCPACTFANLQNQPVVLYSSAVNAPFTNAVSGTATEVAYLNGINANGTIADTSFWTDNGQTAHKWGSSAAGTGAGTLTFAFDPASNFTTTEQQTFLEALGLWSSVADVAFEQTASTSGADIVLTRGSDGSAHTTVSASNARDPSRVGSIRPSATISIDTSVGGFDLSGSFSTFSGYGLATVIHEIGHALGLGHAGDYNGSANASTQQLGQFDTRLWSVMSYIRPDDASAEYYSSYAVGDTNWGGAQTPTTMQALDIEAIQGLYGSSSGGPLSGGQTFGYHSNVGGAIAPIFDFSVNTTPIVTLYDGGTGNTLDLSGLTGAATIDLRDGHFSSFDGLVNNLGIAFGTRIDTAIGGAGPNEFHVNADSDTVVGMGSQNDVAFDDPYSDYIVQGSGTNVVVTFGSIVDSLTDVQQLTFSDQSVALSCFAAGTPIATPAGDRRVEHLRAGDPVTTPDGPVPVRWIGHRRADFRADPALAAARPIRFRAHALAPGVPRRDVWLSPEHGVLVDGMLVPAGCLENGGSIVCDTVRSRVTYYHIELDRHSVLSAAGMPAESWRDTGSRSAFANAAEAPPAPSPAPACAPILTAGPALTNIRMRLTAMAYRIGRPPPKEAVLPLAAIGASTLTLPPGTPRVRLLAHPHTIAPDLRTLGALVTGIRFDGQVVPLHGAALTAGFHSIERHGDTIVRWTGAEAVLTLLPAAEVRRVTVEVGALASRIAFRT